MAIALTTPLRDSRGRFVSRKNFPLLEYLECSASNLSECQNKSQNAVVDYSTHIVYSALRESQAFKSNKAWDLYGIMQFFKKYIHTDEEFRVLLQYCSDTSQILFWTSENTLKSLYSSQLLTTSMLKILYEDVRQLVLLKNSKIHKRDLYTNSFLNSQALEHGWLTFQSLVDRFEKLGVLEYFLKFVPKQSKYFFIDDYRTLHSYVSEYDLKEFQRVVFSNQNLDFLEVLKSEKKFFKFVVSHHLLEMRYVIERSVCCSKKPKSVCSKWSQLIIESFDNDIKLARVELDKLIEAISISSQNKYIKEMLFNSVKETIEESL